MHLAAWHHLRQVFGLDLRSLALFRVAVALVILTDLALRARDLEAHYTDAGVLPRAYFLVDRSRWSVHLLGGSTAFQAFLFLLTALFAVCLLVGYRTRLATCASWFLLVSMHSRNWMLLDSGDAILAVMMFWSMFLPLGARFSVDWLLSPPRVDSGSLFVSVATVAFLVQLCLVYWCAVAQRTDPNWWNGRMLYYVLNYDLLVTRWGIWFRDDVGWLLSPLSLAVIWWEVLGPGLVWIPWKAGFLRTLAVLGFVCLHLGLAAFLSLGIFPLICIVTWLAVLPRVFWELVGQQFRPVSADFSVPLPRRPFERVTRRALPAESKFSERTSGYGMPAGLRGCFAHVLAPPSMSLKPSRQASFLAAFFLCYVLGWNLSVLKPQRFAFPVQLNFVAYVFCLGQNWNMFTPGPPVADGWYLVVAELKDGQKVDIMNRGGDVVWAKPALVSRIFPNHRWRRYLHNLVKLNDELYWRYYWIYLARKWNTEHEANQHLESLQFYLMHEETHPDSVSEPTKLMVRAYQAK